MSGAAAPDPVGPSGVRWVMFALACATSWFLYLHRYTWNIVGPALKDQFGFDNTELGTLFSAFNAAYAIGQIPSGVLCDFLGPHLFLGTIIVAWSLLLPAFGFTGNVYALGTLRALFGTAQAGCYPGLAKVTHAWFPLRIRTTLQGWVATFFGRSGGAMSSIIMGTLLMGWLGLSWQTALVLMGVAGVLFGVVFLALFRNTPAEHPAVNEAERELIASGTPETGHLPRILPARRAMRSSSLRVFVVQQFLDAGSDIVFVSFIGLYFLHTRGLDIKEAGILVSLPLWGGACGGVAGGLLNDWLLLATGNRRWSRSSVGFGGKLLACVTLLFMLRLESAVAIGAALFVAKFFSDTSQPTVWGTCTDLGGRYSATVFSVINTAGTLGATVMPIIFGWVLDRNTQTTTTEGESVAITDWTPLFALIAAMYLASGLCWFLIDCTKSLEQEVAPSPPGESLP